MFGTLPPIFGNGNKDNKVKDADVKKLMELGFTKDKVLATLK
jgi:hypothetical protein